MHQLPFSSSIGADPDECSIKGRRVLVTGGGGSIGSELVLQIAAREPALLVIADISELNLYKIDLQVARVAPAVKRLPIILDIRDKAALHHLFSDLRPDMVFHAAALKHVPLLENTFNLMEAVLTNLGGTANLCDACLEFGSTMLLISTDKAVNPISNMGRTKRLSEVYAHGIAQRYRSDRILQVRFGNVLGSSGSVLPLFEAQIARGGPITVTHPEMTRYMITVDQAVSLVLNALTYHAARRDEFAVYVLDMGQPVRIVDLAMQLISGSGREGIEIEFIGPRPGEKLQEELSYPWEVLAPTGVSRVNVAVPDFRAEAYLDDLRSIIHAAQARQSAAALRAIEEFFDAQMGGFRDAPLPRFASSPIHGNRHLPETVEPAALDDLPATIFGGYAGLPDSAGSSPIQRRHRPET
jgi:FlaA1/EpsC-like NDP-sugar epimerase